jgi:hypothetical protein
MKKKASVQVKDISVNFISHREDDYISLTDIARYKNPLEPKTEIQHWFGSQNVIEFLGVWERINNTSFKGTEMGAFREMAKNNDITISIEKWVTKTDAVGIFARRGRYGSGTFAHKDIALEFAGWISPEFKLYLIKEFQRLKALEQDKTSLGWNLKRELAKVNYKIHTDAIKEHLIPPLLSIEPKNIIYASEADVLNVALFGMTAQEWREKNPDKEGNVRDYATLEQLVVLSNLESLNAELIREELPQGKRLEKLNQVAIYQVKSLLGNTTVKNLK